MRRRHALLLFALLLTARTAAAQPGATSPTPSDADTAEPTETTSYASYTLAVDALGIGAIIAGGIAEGPGGRDTDASKVLFGVGFFSAMLASPLVHGVHGHWKRAAASVGIRYGLASVGMVAGIAMSSCDGSHELFCGLSGAGIGMISGLAAASLIDAVFLAGDERPARVARTNRPNRLWAPTVAANQQGVHLGFAAQF
jgi:hypothetical protein